MSYVTSRRGNYRTELSTWPPQGFKWFETICKEKKILRQKGILCNTYQREHVWEVRLLYCPSAHSCPPYTVLCIWVTAHSWTSEERSRQHIGPPTSIRTWVNPELQCANSHLWIPEHSSLNLTTTLCLRKHSWALLFRKFWAPAARTWPGDSQWIVCKNREHPLPDIMHKPTPNTL